MDTEDKLVPWIISNGPARAVVYAKDMDEARKCLGLIRYQDASGQFLLRASKPDLEIARERNYPVYIRKNGSMKQIR